VKSMCLQTNSCCISYLTNGKIRMPKYLDGFGADFPFVYYAQQYNVSEEQDPLVAITLKVLSIGNQVFCLILTA